MLCQLTAGVRCPQKCPFDAIMIINLPKNLEKETTHRYGPNAFKLHRCAALCVALGAFAFCLKAEATVKAGTAAPENRSTRPGP